MALSSSRRHTVPQHCCSEAEKRLTCWWRRGGSGDNAAAAAARTENLTRQLRAAAAVIVHGTYTSTSMKATNSCRLTGESVLQWLQIDPSRSPLPAESNLSAPLLSLQQYIRKYCCSKQYIVLMLSAGYCQTIRELERTAEHILRSERNERPSIILLSSAHVIISSEIMPEQQQQQQAESKAKRNN